MHIFQGTGPSIARAIIILVPALSLFWILFATWGRAATLRIFFPPQLGAPSTNIFAILGINFLRVLCLLLAVIAVFATLLAASYFSFSIAAQSEQTAVLIYFLIVLVMLPIVVGAWAAVNWILSLAPMFCALENRGAF